MYTDTERRVVVISIPASHSVGPGLQSRRGDQRYYIRFVVGFLTLSE
jgi:hypothetical protein